LEKLEVNLVVIRIFVEEQQFEVQSFVLVMEKLEEKQVEDSFLLVFPVSEFR
jgi:hypothetical protein